MPLLLLLLLFFHPFVQQLVLKAEGIRSNPNFSLLTTLADVPRLVKSGQLGGGGGLFVGAGYSALWIPSGAWWRVRPGPRPSWALGRRLEDCVLLSHPLTLSLHPWRSLLDEVLAMHKSRGTYLEYFIKPKFKKKLIKIKNKKKTLLFALTFKLKCFQLR